jgi:hypothetical protein
MPVSWVEPDVVFLVYVTTAGPLDPPGSGQWFNLTDHAGVNYIDGDVGISIRRGRSDEFSQFQSGSCSFTLRNNQREFDPNNLSSPFIDILKPRRQVLVVTGRTTSLSTLTVLFSGYIDAWPQSWTSTTGSVEIVAHDLLSVLAQSSASLGSGVLILDNAYQGRLDFGRLAGDLPQQFSGERVDALIGLAGVSSQALDLATGLTRMAAIEPQGDVLGLCQEAESAEAGFLYVDRSGNIMFLDRHSRFRHDRLGTVQAVFTDSEYSGMSVDYSLAQMWNDVRFVRPALGDSDVPVEQAAFDESSIAEFGRRAYGPRSIPVISDAETQARAEFWRDRYGTPQQRPTPVTVKPRRDIDGMFDRVARRELLDRVQLVRTPLGLGDPITFTGLIEQLEHRITNTDWVCTIGISPIDVDEGQDFLVLDDATSGQLDQESLAY